MTGRPGDDKSRRSLSTVVRLIISRATRVFNAAKSLTVLRPRSDLTILPAKTRSESTSRQPAKNPTFARITKIRKEETATQTQLFRGIDQNRIADDSAPAFRTRRSVVGVETALTSCCALSALYLEILRKFFPKSGQRLRPVFSPNCKVCITIFWKTQHCDR
jgi:hypothetical protein